MSTSDLIQALRAEQAKLGDTIHWKFVSKAIDVVCDYLTSKLEGQLPAS